MAQMGRPRLLPGSSLGTLHTGQWAPLASQASTSFPQQGRYTTRSSPPDTGGRP